MKKHKNNKKVLLIIGILVLAITGACVFYVNDYYSTVDLTDDDLKIISIYGSEDKVMNGQKYEEYRENISKDLKEVIIEGGNHAYFGTYGMQEGDGEAKITNKEQIQYTCDVILGEIFNKS